ncbi:MAG: hypothetical protein NTW33_02295, partial [Methanoregula sp.]|nr:hypothetical protein [Methanoregula sp.]
MTVFAAIAVAVVSCGTSTSEITRFADMRAEIIKTSKIFENDPQGNRWGGGGGLWTGNAELALSFWGPPDKITCSVKKTDVWDRRYFPDPIITIEDFKAGNYPEVLPEGNQNRGTGYLSYGSLDFPCPKPVGQIILMIPDLKDSPALEAKQHYSDAMIETALINSKGTILGSLHSFVMGSENLYVMQVKTVNLTQPVSVRLYKHQDTIEFGKSF